MKKINVMKMIFLVSICMCAAGGCTAKTQEAVTENELDKVTFYGVKDPQISLIQIMADKLGYFEEEGLEIDNIYLPTVQDLAPLMVNGQAGIACATNYSAAVWKMNGAKIKIIAPLANIGGTQCVLINSEIKIEEPEDLEGLKIGFLSGSTQQLLFMRMCKALNLDTNSFEMVPLQFPDQLTAISNGQVDMIATTQPWITKTEDIMDVTVLCSGIESYIPGAKKKVDWCNTYSGIIVQNEWLMNNQETAKKIIRAMDKAAVYLNDNRESAVTILAEELEVTSDEMERMMKNNKYEVIVDDTYISTTSELLDYIKEGEMVKNGKDISVASYHDFSILKESLPDNYKSSIDLDN